MMDDFNIFGFILYDRDWFINIKNDIENMANLAACENACMGFEDTIADKINIPNNPAIAFFAMGGDMRFL